MKVKRYFMVISIFCMAVVALYVVVPSAVSAVEYRLQDFMILVDDQLIIQGPANVLSFQGGQSGTSLMRTDLGSRNFIQAGGRSKANIPIECPTITDVCLIAPHVTLGNFACVSCVISQNPGVPEPFVDVGTAGRKGPTAIGDDLGNNFLNDTGIPDLPDFPQFPVFVPGTEDKSVPTKGVLNLPPGSYRDLFVGVNATVHFATGIYNFRRIVVNTASRYNLIFEDEVEIRVKQFVRLAAYGNLNPTDANCVFMYVEGTDDSYVGINRNQKGVYDLLAAFKYDGAGKANLSFVFANNGTMNLKGVTSSDTRWFGRSFQQISTSRVILSQNDCPPPSDTPDCACLTDFTVRSDGTLRLKGMNLKPELVHCVGLFADSGDTCSPVYSDVKYSVEVPDFSGEAASCAV